MDVATDEGRWRQLRERLYKTVPEALTVQMLIKEMDGAGFKRQIRLLLTPSNWIKKNEEAISTPLWNHMKKYSQTTFGPMVIPTEFKCRPLHRLLGSTLITVWGSLTP